MTTSERRRRPIEEVPRAVSGIGEAASGIHGETRPRPRGRVNKSPTGESSTAFLRRGKEAGLSERQRIGETFPRA